MKAPAPLRAEYCGGEEKESIQVHLQQEHFLRNVTYDLTEERQRDDSHDRFAIQCDTNRYTDCWTAIVSTPIQRQKNTLLSAPTIDPIVVLEKKTVRRTYCE